MYSLSNHISLQFWKRVFDSFLNYSLTFSFTKRYQSLYAIPKIIWITALNPNLSHRWSRCLSAFCAHKLYSASAPSVKGLIFTLRFWLFWDSVEFKAATWLISIRWSLELLYWLKPSLSLQKKKFESFSQFMLINYCTLVAVKWIIFCVMGWGVERIFCRFTHQQDGIENP